jgi:alanyl-tRNA synthetase
MLGAALGMTNIGGKDFLLLKVAREETAGLPQCAFPRVLESTVDPFIAGHHAGKECKRFMKKLSGSEIRRMFLDYFVQHGHREVHSSSLVPANDPTLLFTNAGMNQFKDTFLGLEKRDYNRATTSQKCVRAGGKHNDLENVGFTNRHHTFFEMLGNFSFGDYFKREAVAYAWELITSPQWFGIPAERLFCTIFKGENGVPRDEEAYNLWRGQGVPPERIYEFGLKDNFWQMGDTGPCGPCSEIHYDMGPAASVEGHTDCQFGCECGRYVEIWNLVFMQFDRDAGGTLNPLPKPSIDTGMGLERITAVLQGCISNYDTDLFVPLIRRAAELTGVMGRITDVLREKGIVLNDDVDMADVFRRLSDVTRTVPGKQRDRESPVKSAASLRVIADHARAATFLISDGVIPANDGRGYVLRKIIRRAIRHGRLLGQNKPFLHQMVYAVRDLMKGAYPELIESAERVVKVIHTEEVRFAHTLNIGLSKLEADLDSVIRNYEEAQAIVSAQSPTDEFDISPQELEGLRDEVSWGLTYRGEHAFRLYDTFGLPLDFIVDAARDRGIAFDQAGFDRAMSEQRARAQASWKGAAKQAAGELYANVPLTEFEGYRSRQSRNCKILFLIQDGKSVPGIKAGEEADVILDHTPFYAESGGQVGDVGWFLGSDHQTKVAEVKGCYFPVQGVRAHQVVARAALLPGDLVDAVVDLETREQTMRHHTGTHLLHAALREVLGKHVKQAGSLVAPGYLRFDFSHFTGVEDEELQDIEDLANKEVLRNDPVQVRENVPLETAINEMGAMALFGEKYGDQVRVIKIGDFSTELCGGTHTQATGEIGLLKILREGSVSSGVRRIEAIAGLQSLQHFRADHELEHVARALVRSGDAEASLATALRRELEDREEEIKRLRKELEQARMKSAAASTASVAEQIREVKGVKVLAHRVDNLERPQLRTLIDNLRNKLGSGIVALGSVADGNVALAVGVTKDLTGRVQAGKIIQPLAKKVGGSGGGRPDMAEAGGKAPEMLDEALAATYGVVEGLLK